MLSRAATSRTGTVPNHPPPLISGSTCSLLNSVLTDTIQITQITQLATTNIREKPHINIEDEGTFSDY